MSILLAALALSFQTELIPSPSPSGFHHYPRPPFCAMTLTVAEGSPGDAFCFPEVLPLFTPTPPMHGEPGEEGWEVREEGEQVCVI